MSEQKANKNKVGARSLSTEEARLILPTYDQIFGQIQQFRKEKEFTDHDKLQKTNNIGIIGVRGAGKTSVLKTIRVTLEQIKKSQHLKDVILPIIVPENMSESSTLMATILGMLGEVVDRRDKEEREAHKDCIKKGGLKEKYEELIKQYTFIQKEYRDILIREYTTENDYVRSSAKVLNSDTEFIKKFNDLIDTLVNAKEQGESLLFLFIDDIDLSTHRCADVVKTLLSYLSNENIVTFISGDLETFEEALTLDFLRQEKVLDYKIFTESMIGNGVAKKSILESKKQLAYEYLKKILPPIYRHTIKYWFLEEKGKYLISAPEAVTLDPYNDKDDKLKTKENINRLSNLLLKALDGWIDPAFFIYKEANPENGEIEEEVLPYTYHLFDNTSRGLNNIYNLLSEINEKRIQEYHEQDVPGKDYLKEKKLLLDTIVAAKSIYNKYRTEIQKNMFHVGMIKEDSHVFFDNAFAIIYKKEISEDKKTGTQTKRVIKNNYLIKDPIERFSLFILVDFAARLLYEKEYTAKTESDNFYTLLKKNAMEDLFFYPSIAEKTMNTGNYYLIVKDNKNQNSPNDLTLNDFNINLLSEGELVFNLAYYKNLPLDRMLQRYEEDVNNKDTDIELEQHSIIAFWKAISSIAMTKGDKTRERLAIYFPVFWKEFSYIQNHLSSSVTQNMIIQLFENECKKAVNEKFKVQYHWENQDKIRILLNTIAHLLKDKDRDEIKSEWQEITDYEKLVNTRGQAFSPEEQSYIETRITILKMIDLKQLWIEEAADSVVRYLYSEVVHYLEHLAEKIFSEPLDIADNNRWKLYTNASYYKWLEFYNSYSGESYNTKSNQTKRAVLNVLSEQGEDFRDGLSYKTYIKIVDNVSQLAGNWQVWYGRSEAQSLLNALQESSCVIDTNGNVYSYFIILLQGLLKYKIASQSINDIRRNSILLKEITDTLTTAHRDADKKVLVTFITDLNKDLTNKINSEDFEKLFNISES